MLHAAAHGHRADTWRPKLRPRPGPMCFTWMGLFSAVLVELALGRDLEFLLLLVRRTTGSQAKLGQKKPSWLARRATWLESDSAQRRAQKKRSNPTRKPLCNQGPQCCSVAACRIATLSKAVSISKKRHCLAARVTAQLAFQGVNMYVQSLEI